MWALEPMAAWGCPGHAQSVHRRQEPPRAGLPGARRCPPSSGHCVPSTVISASSSPLLGRFCLSECGGGEGGGEGGGGGGLGAKPNLIRDKQSP